LQPLSAEKRHELKRKLNLSDSDVVVVAGSTHEGEESALLDALRQLPHLKLILAPRHPERFQRVFQIVESYGYRVRAFSRGEAFERQNDVYVLDTIGQLTAYYSQATIAFVGGTLAPIGGHNIVEPCLYEVPVICGPHVEKTRDVANALLERRALTKISQATELPGVLRALIENPDERRRLGIAGRKFLDDSQGAVERTLSVVENLLGLGAGERPTAGCCMSAPGPTKGN
jgi:3-deoxy-D-manno-octulosonic-acid transferase